MQSAVVGGRSRAAPHTPVQPEYSLHIALVTHGSKQQYVAWRGVRWKNKKRSVSFDLVFGPAASQKYTLLRCIFQFCFAPEMKIGLKINSYVFCFTSKCSFQSLLLVF